MHAVSSYMFMGIALAGAADFTAIAHHIHSSHVVRRLEMDMSGMDMTPSTLMEKKASSTTSDDDYKCPVCGMSTKDMNYDNLNHIGFVNGQIVYTCGMAPRSFDGYKMDYTDTAYLAANMAEFIVNITDITAYAECENSCEACGDGIKDPVTGDNVTTSNYQYVCLSNGQKLYFASTTSKNKYLTNVNLEPRYLVNSIICHNKTCLDAEKITELSAAAKAFVPDLLTSNNRGSAIASDSSAAVSVKALASLTFVIASGMVVLAAMA
ncbi:hypothetical protein KXD40_003376 [Peronospora effusa]|uniref:Uncharacterized protein n=1 Tax=Peronospora effusa TaxID=542832 RepID=A0A3M6VPN1_9STRA|nr:hypothetical protein DD238_001438 [Peronospora effusa]UIZ29415.1 hypothetical protein KXD40_003376 [Peronospora effusa]CAI5702449.1 unnamed protein product [Peronospora effusa]